MGTQVDLESAQGPSVRPRVLLYPVLEFAGGFIPGLSVAHSRALSSLSLFRQDAAVCVGCHASHGWCLF